CGDGGQRPGRYTSRAAWRRARHSTSRSRRWWRARWPRPQSRPGWACCRPVGICPGRTGLRPSLPWEGCDGRLRSPSGVGGERRGAVGRGAVGWLAGALVLPILAFSITAVAAALTAQALPPPPFRGPDTVDVVLTSPGGDAQHDAPLVRARMVALGVAARVLAAGGGRITMRLPRVQKVAELVQQVGARKELALFWAADDQAPLAQALAGRPLPSGREAQASLVAALKLGPGQRAAIECKEPPEEAPGPPTCKPWLLVAPPVLATRDLARAEVAFDPMDGRPRISVELHAASV